MIVVRPSTWFDTDSFKNLVSVTVFFHSVSYRFLIFALLSKPDLHLLDLAGRGKQPQESDRDGSAPCLDTVQLPDLVQVVVCFSLVVNAHELVQTQGDLFGCEKVGEVEQACQHGEHRGLDVFGDQF